MRLRLLLKFVKEEYVFILSWIPMIVKIDFFILLLERNNLANEKAKNSVTDIDSVGFAELITDSSFSH